MKGETRKVHCDLLVLCKFTTLPTVHWGSEPAEFLFDLGNIRNRLQIDARTVLAPIAARGFEPDDQVRKEVEGENTIRKRALTP
jgi:hypothetical protein